MDRHNHKSLNIYIYSTTFEWSNKIWFYSCFLERNFIKNPHHNHLNTNCVVTKWKQTAPQPSLAYWFIAFKCSVTIRQRPDISPYICRWYSNYEICTVHIFRGSPLTTYSYYSMFNRRTEPNRVDSRPDQNKIYNMRT